MTMLYETKDKMMEDTIVEVKPGDKNINDSPRQIRNRSRTCGCSGEDNKRKLKISVSSVDGFIIFDFGEKPDIVKT